MVCCDVPHSTPPPLPMRRLKSAMLPPDNHILIRYFRLQLNRESCQLVEYISHQVLTYNPWSIICELELLTAFQSDCNRSGSFYWWPFLRSRQNISAILNAPTCASSSYQLRASGFKGDFNGHIVISAASSSRRTSWRQNEYFILREASSYELPSHANSLRTK